MSEAKILLGIVTAYHPSRWHRRQILREQCLKNSPLPYKFVFGDEPFPGDVNAVEFLMTKSSTHPARIPKNIFI